MTLQQVCEFLNIEPFSSEKLEQFQTQVYAHADYERQSEDEATLEKLRHYFKADQGALQDLLAQKTV